MTSKMERGALLGLSLVLIAVLAFNHLVVSKPETLELQKAVFRVS